MENLGGGNGDGLTDVKICGKGIGAFDDAISVVICLFCVFMNLLVNTWVAGPSFFDF